MKKSLLEILKEGRKDEYVIYHKSYSAAADEITKFAEKNGYTLDDQTDKEDIGTQMYNEIGRGPKKPSNGKTNKFHFKLYKNNSIQKKQLHAQIYGDNGRFELNMYIS
jgi:Mg2+/Co2+ transporter CorC